MARVCASRKNMWSVMDNSGFGDLVIYKENKKVVVPQKYITREGLVYKRVNKHIVEKNFKELEELGVAIV